MFKTHKPRGYSWTHASAFQQTKEFRDISYYECAAPTSRALTPNSDAVLSEGERRRKRRRIEKLADDFLNGQPLFISSARPCSEALKTTITWNQKSSTEPKFEFAQSTVPHEPSALWQDVDDNDAILGRHYTGSVDIHTRVKAKVSTLPAGSVDGDLEQPVLQAIPRPPRGLESANISTGPSSDALRKAAALRARKAYQVGREEEESPEPELASARRLRNSDKKVELKRPKEWLSWKEHIVVTAKSDYYEEECLDELRLSRIETPTNPPGRTRSSALSQHVARLVVSNQSRSGQDLDSDSPPVIVTPRISETINLLPDESHDPEHLVHDQANNACIESNSYHTAHEDTNIHSNDDQEGDNDEIRNGHSQTRLLKSQGFEGASPTSWRAVNQSQPQQCVNPMHASTDSRQSESAVGGNSTIPVPPSTSARPRRSARHDVASQAQTVTQHRRPPTRPRDQAVYKTEPASGLSPFKWRRKVTFPSSDEIIVEPRPKQAKAANDKNVSQSAPVTPATTTPQLSSNQPAPSAQVDAAHSSPVLTSHTPANGAGITMLQQSLPETWAGTQAMLLKAQQDLVTSPEKPDHTPAAVKDQDFMTVDNESQCKPASQKSDREPLKQLSQEPIPSTQAMIGDFVGFSTVKKPWRDGPRESIDSPSVLLRAKEAKIRPTDITSPDTSERHDQSIQSRPSGLRFSMDSVESSLQSTNINEAPSPSSPIIRRGADWSSTDVATSSKKSGSRNAAIKSSPIQQQVPTTPAEAEREEKSQSHSFSTTAALPSFQAAQAWSSLPLSQEEDSNIDQTIEELTTYLLDTTDMQGVLS